MVTYERMLEIQSYVKFCQERLDASIRTREKLEFYRTQGFYMTDMTGADLFMERCAQEEQAIKSWERSLQHAQALQVRAEDGEIV